MSSSQYGGTSISLTHLTPFVRDSYERYLNKFKSIFVNDEALAIKTAKDFLKREVKDGVQTFNYQINSMTTTNGQAPFLTVFMYLNETQEYKEELVMNI